jgi:hypothetical protein
MKTVFSDPISWAENTAGTKQKYKLMVTLSIIGGIIIICNLLIVSLISGSIISLIISISICILVVIFAIEFPIFYLKAINALLTERKKEKKNSTQQKNGV